MTTENIEIEENETKTKTKGKQLELFYKHDDNIKIEKDSSNWILTYKNKQLFYTSLDAAISRFSKLSFVDKLKDISDEDKESLSKMLEHLKEHNKYIKSLFGEY